MRLRTLFLALMVVPLITGCESRAETSVEVVEPIPTAVNCGDAPQLRERAGADRRRVEQSRSDHERISLGSRANFLASLAVIADLKCKVTFTSADETLKRSLDLAREAESSDSIYEKTRRFHDADFTARQVIDMLIPRLVAAPVK